MFIHLLNITFYAHNSLKFNALTLSSTKHGTIIQEPMLPKLVVDTQK